MSRNNITSISQFQQKSTAVAVTLDGVQAAINAWRETKKAANEKMPTTLWDQIIALLETAPESKTLAALSVSRPQLDAEKRRRQSQTQLANKDDAVTHPKTIDFCEVKQHQPEPSTSGLVYKPAESFSTTTSVVEIYRPDGMLMKIHICTERFSELLSAFFKA